MITAALALASIEDGGDVLTVLADGMLAPGFKAWPPPQRSTE